MAQLTGSGPGNGTNYVMVDDTIGSTPFGFPTGRLFTNSEGWEGAVGPMTLDKATHATNTIEYEHHEIHSGKHFNQRGFQVLTNSGDTLVFGFQTPNGSTWAHLVFEVDGTTQTEVRGWEGATLSGGILQTPFNNNRNSTNICGCIVRANPIISGTSPTSGLLIEEHSKGLGGATPSKADAVGTVDRGDEWILKSGTTYMWEIKTADTGNVIDYAARWYEHTDKTQIF